jgi:excisionase family DNA binding protein
MADKGDVPIDPFSRYQMYTLLGAAKLLAVSRSTIERLRDHGKLGPWHQFGRRWYIQGSCIKEYFDRESGNGAENLEAAE